LCKGGDRQRLRYDEQEEYRDAHDFSKIGCRGESVQHFCILYCRRGTGISRIMDSRRQHMAKHYDPWAIIVVALTLILFITALFLKGLSHDLLLETGVFLVSVKLIMMSYKNSILAQHTEERLEQIYSLLQDSKNHPLT
jgi:hypothetical protein